MKSSPLNESGWKRVSVKGGDWRYKIYNRSVLLENPKGDRDLVEAESITGLSAKEMLQRQAFARPPVDAVEIRDYIEKISAS